MISVDLNCDMGESFGAWTMGNDSELMDHVTSVNIACGFHAGDASTIRLTVQTAVEKGVAIGAHPGYPDLQGFGRRNMSISPQEVFDIVLYQVAALKGVCEATGARLHHVKPHGALYNQASRDRVLSRSVAEAVSRIDKDLIVYGLAGSFLISEARGFGLRTASEAFADRTYQRDGTLTPRNHAGALITDVEKSVEHALGMIREQSVVTVEGDAITINADTICIHGDGEHALEFASSIRNALEENGITIARPHSRPPANR